MTTNPHPEGQSGARQGVRVGREGMVSAQGSTWGSRCRVDHKGSSRATGGHQRFLRVSDKIRCVF